MEMEKNITKKILFMKKNIQKGKDMEKEKNMITMEI